MTAGEHVWMDDETKLAEAGVEELKGLERFVRIHELRPDAKYVVVADARHVSRGDVQRLEALFARAGIPLIAALMSDELDCLRFFEFKESE